MTGTNESSVSNQGFCATILIGREGEKALLRPYLQVEGPMQQPAIFVLHLLKPCEQLVIFNDDEF